MSVKTKTATSEQEALRHGRVVGFGLSVGFVDNSLFFTRKKIKHRLIE